jgi:hypothetical protein
MIAVHARVCRSPLLIKLFCMLLPFVRELFTDVEVPPAFVRVASQRKGGISRTQTSVMLGRHLLNQRASIAAVWLRIWSDDYGGGYSVARLHIQQPDTLRVAAGFADCG